MKPNLSKSLREGLASVVGRFAVWVGMLALSLTFFAASQAHAGRRVALLLVAEDYSNFNRSAVGVTRGLEIAGLLRARDFDVIVSANPTNATGRAALGDFLLKVKGADLAIVLLIGHGISALGQTFFLPQNATVERSTDLFSQGLSIANMIRIAGNAQVAGVCFLMTAPNFPAPLDDVELGPRVDGNPSANVIAAFSNSTRTPASEAAAAASQAADTITALLQQNSHASLRQFSSACANKAQGMTIGEAPDLDLVTTRAQMASQPPPAVRMPDARPPEAPPAPTPTPALVLAVPIAPQPLQPVDPDVAVTNAAAAPLTATQERALKPKDTFRECENCPEMVVVPAGRFAMGSPAGEKERNSNEGPQHDVTIGRPFALGKFHVTVDQFAVFARETDYAIRSACDWRNPGFTLDGSHPVVCISWDDANAYVNWLAKKTGKPYRLVSEAEFEYAARAGTTTPFWWGSSITPAQANYNGNYLYAEGGSKGVYRKGTVSVGSFDANPWGLHNVHGNVWQWTADCWHDNYNSAPTDGSAWTSAGCNSERVIRGGSWFNHPGGLRAARRDRVTVRSDGIGFRVARTLISAESSR